MSGKNQWQLLFCVTCLLAVVLGGSQAHLQENSIDATASGSDSERSSISESTSSTHEDSQKEGYRLDFADWSGIVTEKNDYTYILTQGKQTSLEGNTYIFESCLTEESRYYFIEKQTELLKMLDVKETGYTFFLTESYIDRGDSEHGFAFVAEASIGSWKQVLSTLFLLDGDRTLYGYAYAKAISIADSLGWDGDEAQERTSISEKDIQGILEEDPGRINLFLPCFLEPYSTTEQICAAKSLALNLYASLEERTEDGFVAAIQNYARENGLEYMTAEMDFCYGGKTHPIIMETPYTVEYIPRTYDADAGYAKAYPPEQLWLTNMTEWIRIRNLLHLNMGIAKESIHPRLQTKCDIFFREDSLGGCYTVSDFIRTNSVLLLAHEYVHYLHYHAAPQRRRYQGRTDYGWVLEGLAEYYGTLPMAYEYNAFWRAYYEEPIPTYAEYAAYYYWIVKDRILSGESLREQLTGTQIGVYDASLAITVYLVDKYGEEAMLDYYLFRLYPEEAAEKKQEEFFQEFEDFILSYEGFPEESD